MCNCLNEARRTLLQSMIDDTKGCHTIPCIEFTNEAYLLNKVNNYSRLVSYAEGIYWKDGKKKKWKKMIVPSYCQFCGVNLDSEAE